MSTYIWRTQMDDRVRDSHAALEGLVFEDGVGLEPGQEYNCRCYKEEIEDIEGEATGAEEFGFDVGSFSSTLGKSAASSFGLTFAFNTVAKIVSKAKIPSQYGKISSTGMNKTLSKVLSKIPKVFGKATPYVAGAAAIFRLTQYVIQKATVSDILSNEIGILIGTAAGGKASSLFTGSVFKSTKSINKATRLSENLMSGGNRLDNTLTNLTEGYKDVQKAAKEAQNLKDKMNSTFKKVYDAASKISKNKDLGNLGITGNKLPGNGNRKDFNFPGTGKIF